MALDKTLSFLPFLGENNQAADDKASLFFGHEHFNSLHGLAMLAMTRKQVRDLEISARQMVGFKHIPKMTRSNRDNYAKKDK